MPKMDGFSFLRLLMARQPTPVLVISGYATRENVFKALELGALDFVAKPSRTITPELRNIQEELLAKVAHGDAAAHGEPRRSRGADAARRAPCRARSRRRRRRCRRRPSRKEGPAPPRLIAIGASTGGPPAINRILVSLEPTLPLGHGHHAAHAGQVHQAFAERLDRTTPWHVREAEPGDAISTGCVLVAPGSGSLAVRARRADAARRRSSPPQPERPLRAVGRPHAVERGRGDAGRPVAASCSPAWAATAGAASRRSRPPAGGPIAEAPETAVIFGMPQEAIATGAVDEVVPLGSIARGHRALRPRRSRRRSSAIGAAELPVIRRKLPQDGATDLICRRTRMSKPDDKQALPELDLVESKREFIETFFKRGAEFTEELMRENEKLRFRVVQLEEERRALAPPRSRRRPAAGAGALRELVSRIEQLEREREPLLVALRRRRAAEPRLLRPLSRHRAREQQPRQPLRGVVPAALDAGSARAHADHPRDPAQLRRRQDLRHPARRRRSRQAAHARGRGRRARARCPRAPSPRGASARSIKTRAATTIDGERLRARADVQHLDRPVIVVPLKIRDKVVGVDHRSGTCCAEDRARRRRLRAVQPAWRPRRVRVARRVAGAELKGRAARTLGGGGSGLRPWRPRWWWKILRRCGSSSCSRCAASAV